MFNIAQFVCNLLLSVLSQTIVQILLKRIKIMFEPFLVQKTALERKVIILSESDIFFLICAILSPTFKSFNQAEAIE